MVRSYVDLGWHPIPLCWPTVLGLCACGRGHHEHGIGKAPLARSGYQDRLVTAKKAARWWSWRPDANVALLLEPSELVVVDIDGRDALDEAHGYGLPETLSVETGKGWHYYYRRPKNCSVGRATQRGESRLIDVLSKGYVVAPPSIHASGRVYVWSGRPVSELPDVPKWARELLPRPAWMLPKGFRPPSRKFEEGHADPPVIHSALAFIEPEEYELWLHIGFALQTWDDVGNGNGRGFRIWDQWSQRSSKYPGTKELKTKWNSFRKQSGGLGLGTLFEFAKRQGWDPDRLQSIESTGGSWHNRALAVGGA